MGVCQLFVTCLVDALAPEVGRACVELLEGAGLEVQFSEDQTCCGQPAYNAGYRDQARRVAAQTVSALDRTEGPIVVPSGSCADMLAHHVPALLADGPHAGPARRVAARVRELTQFLVDDLGAVPAGTADGRRVACHVSCHGLRGLGIRDQPGRLVESVADRVPVRDAEECCGFGGLFSLELPEVSAASMRRKIRAVEESGAEILVGTDLGCLLHLAGGLHRAGSPIRVLHIAQLLRESTR
ncbi:MAG: iron-sulfur protein [Acidimicrobiia bacterium]|nr:MAG: iron-sulfur protein [Acidimicrobiia bacterium]